MNKETSRRISRVFFWILVIIIFFYLMFPFYWAVVSALKSEAELIQTPATLWPQDPSLRNFRAVFQNQAFLRGLLNSTIVATSATVLSLLVGSFAGYALGKLRFRGKTLSLYTILAMTMFPQIAILAGLYQVIRFLNMPTTLSLVLSYLLFTLPFTAWVLTSFFRGSARFTFAGRAGRRGQYDANILAGFVTPDHARARNHRASGFYHRLERISVRPYLYGVRQIGADGAGRYRPVFRTISAARTVR